MIFFENFSNSGEKQIVPASFSTNDLHYFFPYSEKERFLSLTFDSPNDVKISVNGKLLFPSGRFQKFYKIQFKSNNNFCFDAFFLNDWIDTAPLEAKIEELNQQGSLSKTLDLVFGFVKENQALYVLFDMNEDSNSRYSDIIMKEISKSDNQFFVLARNPAVFGQQGAVVSPGLAIWRASNFNKWKRFLLECFFEFFCSFFCLLFFGAGLSFQNEKNAYFYILIFAGLFSLIIHFVLAMRLLHLSPSTKMLSSTQIRRLIFSSCLTTLLGSLCAIGLCILIISYTQIFPISSFAGTTKGISILISLALITNCILASFFSSRHKKKL